MKTTPTQAFRQNFNGIFFAIALVVLVFAALTNPKLAAIIVGKLFDGLAAIAEAIGAVAHN